MARFGRDKALRMFELDTQMPKWSPEEEVERITSELNDVYLRKVDNFILQSRKRRLDSRPDTKPKEIDEVIVKSLARLCNSVDDIISFEHQAQITKSKATSRSITRNVRDTKANQLARKKILEETQERTRLRQNKIYRKTEKRIRKAASNTVAKKHEIVKTRKLPVKDSNILTIAEIEFDRIIKLEEDETRKSQMKKRIATKAKVAERRQLQKDNIASNLRKLRQGMDRLDSAADASLHRRNLRR